MSETQGFIKEENTSKLPDNTAFKQQRLPAWQPIYTARSVFPIFLVTSVVFLGIGILLLLTSWAAIEYSHDYTDCYSQDNPEVQCSSLIGNALEPTQPCTCSFSLDVTTPITGNVFMYYGLDGFYQNHRRYVRSRDDNQLIGGTVDTSNINIDCAPYDVYRENGQELVIAPCGAIANSLFNDSFSVSFDNISVPILRTGIAWPTDHVTKFNNPPGDIRSAFSQTRMPRFWSTPVQYLDNTSDANNGYKHEPLIVWMRTAAFPKFRKLYGRLDRRELFVEGLQQGRYTIVVSYNYPVIEFGGRKRFIMANTTWMGGRNDFLGWAYICAGIFSGFMCIVLWVLYLIGKKKHRVYVQPAK